MSLLDLGEEGFHARASADAQLAAILDAPAGEERILYGWPAEILEEPAEPEFPRITYFAPSDSEQRPGIGRVRLQVDLWAWRSGERGGPGKLKAMDDRLTTLFQEARWEHDGRRLNGMRVSRRNSPTGAPSPLRRMLEIEVGV